MNAKLEKAKNISVKILKGIYKVLFVIMVVYFGSRAVLYMTYPIYEKIYELITYKKLVPVFASPIEDIILLDKIVDCLDKENVTVTVTPDGIVLVNDTETARRMREILISRDLVPKFEIDPWAVYDKRRWNLTDLERKTNLQRAREKIIRNQIRVFNGIDNVYIQIGWSTEDYPDTTVSLVIVPSPDSDILENKQKIETIQKFLTNSINGLQPENIIISSKDGNILNKF